MYKHEMLPLISAMQKIVEAKNLPDKDKLTILGEILLETKEGLTGGKQSPVKEKKDQH